METLFVSVEKVVTEFSQRKKKKKLVHLNVKFLFWKNVVGLFRVLQFSLFVMVTHPGWVIWRKQGSCVTRRRLQVFSVGIAILVLNCNVTCSGPSKENAACDVGN